MGLVFVVVGWTVVVAVVVELTSFISTSCVSVDLNVTCNGGCGLILGGISTTGNVVGTCSREDSAAPVDRGRGVTRGVAVSIFL